MFATEQEDFTKLDIATMMKGIKRTVRRLGPPVGHRVDGRLLGYEEARRALYLPTYRWMLDYRAPEPRRGRSPAGSGLKMRWRVLVGRKIQGSGHHHGGHEP